MDARWILAGALTASAALGAACSSSSSSSNGGGGDAMDAGGGGGDGAASMDSGGGSGDAGASDAMMHHDGSEIDSGCSTTLHPTAAGTIYCPSVAAGSMDTMCTAMTQHCCMPSKMSGMMSTCVASGTACPAGGGNMGSKVWECSEPANCPSGQVCCATGTIGSGTCGAFQISMFGGTKCAASCAANEGVVCQAQSDCTTGACTPGTAGGATLGLCK
jgi:hypothetical protein